MYVTGSNNRSQQKQSDFSYISDKPVKGQAEGGNK